MSYSIQRERVRRRAESRSAGDFLRRSEDAGSDRASREALQAAGSFQHAACTLGERSIPRIERTIQGLGNGVGEGLAPVDREASSTLPGIPPPAAYPEFTNSIPPRGRDRGHQGTAVSIDAIHGLV